MTIYTWGVDVWDLEECHCGDSPPPTFQIPPPPQLPSLQSAASDGMKMSKARLSLCDSSQDTCLVAQELQINEILPVTIDVPMFLVITAAVTLVFLMIIATALVYRLRNWFVITKGCQHVPTIKLYDGLVSYQQPRPCRNSHRLRPKRDNILGIPVTLQLCSTSSCNQDHHEHLYQSISSGSDTCSYSTSEASPCHKPVHRFNTPLLHVHNNADTDTADENIQLHKSPEAQATHFTTSKPTTHTKTSNGDYSHYINVPKLDTALPNLVINSFNTNNVTSQPSSAAFGSLFPVPCSTCGLSLFPHRSTKFSSHHQYSNTPKNSNVPSSQVKNSYYIKHGRSKGSSLSPEDRGLRPLPSRSPRFKAHFIPDHLQQQQKDIQIRSDRKKYWRTCQCNQKKNKKGLHNSPKFYFNPRYTEGHSQQKSINFSDSKLPDTNKNVSQGQADIGQNHGEVPQFFNAVSVERSRNNHQNEIEHLYENCNDA